MDRNITELNSSIIENLFYGTNISKKTFDFNRKKQEKVSEEKNQQTVQISL
jgi:hypothetical protein